MIDFSNLKNVLLDAAFEAGDAIMDVYHEQEDQVQYKDDKSPVTKADEEAENIILQKLSASYSAIPVIAEEAVSCGKITSTDERYFFLVDPLDGTKEFITRRQDFTVNIALIDNTLPIAGIVYAPAQRTAWLGIENRAEKILRDTNQHQPIRVSTACAETGKRAVVSLSHNSEETEAYLKNFSIAERVSYGSSIKFCMIAEGAADMYPRFGRTMEWDTAAGDAVLRAAGGRTITVDEKPLCYGKRNQANDCDFANPFFIADNSQLTDYV